VTEQRLTYPGFRWAWGGTKDWVREPGGPFVALSYTPPDEDGMSIMRESFHDRRTDAQLACGALRWEDYVDEAGWG
jgi:hypothetical protein